jgi:hypothetical protein
MTDYRDSYDWKYCSDPLAELRQDLRIRPMTREVYEAQRKQERKEAWEKLPMAMLFATAWAILHFGFGML